ncbi:MAG: MFS transporter [Conexibacteraceae bacterium]|nr:MFS transporter [Conexibacteraceae bacterium]
MAAEAPLPLSRNRDFQVLWVSQVLSSGGQQISTVALPLLVLGLTGSAAKAGIVGTSSAIAGYVGGVVCAPVVDRTNRRLVLVVADALRFLAAAAISVLVLSGNANLGLLTVLAAASGLAMVPASAAMQASLVRIVPVSQLDQAIAQDQAREQAARLAGNGLGGLLYGVAASVPFATQALGYLASIFGATRLKTSLAVESSPDLQEGFLQQLTGGARWLFERPAILGAAASTAFCNLAFTGVDLLVIVLARHHGATSFQTGIAVAMGAGGGILGAIIAGRMIAVCGRLGTVLLTLWSQVLLILTLAVAPNYIWLGVILVAVELANPATNVVLLGKFLPTVDDHVRGRVLSAVSVLTSGLSALGPLLAGALYEYIGSAAVIPRATLAALTALPYTVVPGIRAIASEPPVSV